ncbi:MAG: hypothetical protein HY791_26445 [Deltaproteobacteria bacterium]|nr:hypothetical protein [Deltaproteobacteria bacterium]
MADEKKDNEKKTPETPKKKKLVLNEETVKELSDDESDAVAGGLLRPAGYCDSGGNTSAGGCGDNFSFTTQGTCTKSFCGGVC